VIGPGSEVDAAFLAQFGKDTEKVGQTEQFLHSLAQIDDLQLASRTLASRVQPHQRAQAQAVDPLEMGQVEHNQFVVRDQRVNLVIQKTANAGDQPAVTVSDYALVVFLLDFHGEGHGAGFGCHAIAPLERAERPKIDGAANCASK
jgi:hypothetical protein